MVKDSSLVDEKLLPEVVGAGDIREMIFTVRGKQVIFDKDLAVLYHVSTKAFNQSVSRNINRFPENFRFQLTREEFDSLRSHFVTPNVRGGRRYLPYAFTEQGIAMLAGILKSDVAVEISIRIMNTFVEMRRFIANNALLFEKITDVEFRQLEYKKETDEKFDRIFQYIDDHAESEQKIFFDGQIYDAFSLISTLVQKAEKEIILIDGYVDVVTLDILAKKKEGVDVRIYTYPGTVLTKTDTDKFNSQYPSISIYKTKAFHDRFLILDGSTAYHIGASIKDAGKKCFGITIISDGRLVEDLLGRIDETGK